MRALRETVSVIIAIVDSPNWLPKLEHTFQDIKYEQFEGIAKITINRPEVRNAFRPETIFELQTAFADVRDDPSIGVVLFTGEGPDAFCSAAISASAAMAATSTHAVCRA